MNKTKLLIGAAVAGILGAGSVASVSSQADDAAKGDAKTGHCVGANACKGQSACMMGKNQNNCKGMNECKGKGGLIATPVECKKIGGKFKPGKAMHDMGAAPEAPKT